ncbi:hypothetical protein NM208_g1837 [Fusarium decemcellulare]|uniref:Uncharacterized protein n=1 Tax=Fusarium decemcellulare TaxID=57161 RepID=A0ACC1SUU1_9HYPO|nr:hypothetical protein NM208_g1837 [Fusarium decemcellulare]
MRSQNHTFVTIPIPRQVSPHLVLTYLQTYEPVLRHNPGMVSFDETTLDMDLIASDSFFDAADPEHSLRCYQAHEVMWLGPGLQRELRWPIIFQSVANGIVCRVNAPAGVVSWTQWYVQPRQNEASVEDTASSPSTATPSSCADEEWELFGIVTVEAHRMLMPWCMSSAKSYQNQIGQAMVDEVCTKCSTGEL